MEKPKKLTLDYATWRSGGNSKNSVGQGPTLLLNKEGYMCCIGQWMLQCGYKKEEIGGRGTPSSLIVFGGMAEDSISELFIEGRGNSSLTSSAIAINDSTDTLPLERIEKLRALLDKEGIELEVINLPD